VNFGSLSGTEQTSASLAFQTNIQFEVDLHPFFHGAAIIDEKYNIYVLSNHDEEGLGIAKQ
jgi:hypothetical protein